MKTITILIEQDASESDEAHQLECLAAINGKAFYNDLEAVYKVLANFDKLGRKKLTTEQQEVIDEIRSKTAKYFIGIRHGK